MLVAIFAPLLAPYDPNAVDLGNTLAPPSSEHLLGTDASGRDILSRLIYGTRTSLLGPLLVVGISTLVGVPLGLLAGYRGGTVDGVLGRIWDVMFAFPPLLLAIVIVAAFGAGFLDGHDRHRDHLHPAVSPGRARRRARRAGEGVRRRLQGAGVLEHARRRRATCCPTCRRRSPLSRR